MYAHNITRDESMHPKETNIYEKSPRKEISILAHDATRNHIRQYETRLTKET